MSWKSDHLCNEIFSDGVGVREVYVFSPLAGVCSVSCDAGLLTNFSFGVKAGVPFNSPYSANGVTTAVDTNSQTDLLVG